MVNFSDSHNNYNTAYKYVCKEDTSVHHSKRHPNLEGVGSPQTKKATQAYRKKRKQANSEQANSEHPPPKKRKV